MIIDILLAENPGVMEITRQFLDRLQDEMGASLSPHRGKAAMESLLYHGPNCFYRRRSLLIGWGITA